MPFPSPEQISDLLGQLVDQGYQQTAGAVVNAMIAPAESGRLALRLQQLNDEAARLAAAGEKMSPDNPVLATVLDELGKALRANAALVDGISPGLQGGMAAAAAELSRTLALAQNTGIGAAWNTPNVDAVAALVGYVDSAAWRTELANYQANTFEVVLNAAIEGFVNGKNPVTVAKELAARATNLPRSYAEQMMRSLQLTALRDAMVVQQVANADKIQRIVRVAALDNRTCLACVALHGTFLNVGERVNDHRNGRCIGVALLAGQQFSQTYFVDGQALEVRSGEEWLRAHGDAWQRAFMGGANYAAYAAGSVTLPDFVQFYDDPVFGDAIQEASLKGILGTAAKGYYGK